MKNLCITIVQPDIIWEKAADNLRKYADLLSPVSGTDVILLPEMFTTGFSMHPEKLKETMSDMSVQWMKDTARNKNAAVTGSLIIEEQGEVFNRCVWAFPGGEIETYDKKHLFTMSGEHHHYSPGRNRRVITYKGWRFLPLICYDLRFPVWSRNTDPYDVLIYFANWPSPRHQVWKSLLVARAIENQAYCIGVNCTGTDGTGLNYSGDSAFIDAKGVATFTGKKEQVISFNLNYNELHTFRKKFPVLNDRDDFELKLKKPPLKIR